jgi:pyrimidine-nucleoside phosphorylase
MSLGTKLARAVVAAVRTKPGARLFSAGAPVSVVEVIAKKRDGYALSAHEIDYCIKNYDEGKVPDYQMAALLMAIYQRGMDNEETAHLTLAMTQSGRDLVKEMATIPQRKVDKHSTGGVGDKVSLILAPLIASHGITDPMMSGRGLGHTGGTLDKLEAIPGFTCSLSTEQFVDVLKKVGCAIIAPTADIAPVDKKIYALRDVTATVGSLPLICSSIMSKKIASAPEALVLDVKFGSGAFMPVLEDGIELARSMIAAGENANIDTVAIMTDMDQPLGRKAGNWLEIEETIEVLKGGGPDDLRNVTLAFAGQMMVMGDKAKTVRLIDVLLIDCAINGW